MKVAVIYARYSSDRQTEQSIEGQIRVCNEYAERNDIRIVDTYIDRAMTGTNDNRTDFQRMLRDSAKRAWDIVLVYKLDRFSRNKYETAMHKKTLRDNGVKLVSAMENIPDTPEGIILESLLEGMAEYYSAELSQKVKRGMNETRRKGNFTGGIVPFGYKVVNHKLVINEDEAQILRNLYMDFASGKLVTDFLKELREKGIKYRGKDFAKNTLYNILKSEKYIGKYTHNGEVFYNIYPKIIPDELFEIVKHKLDSNKYGKHSPDVIYLLKNKLKCGYCEHPVSSDTGTSKNGSVLRYYKCFGKKYLKNCTLKPVRKEVIEDLVVNAILSAFGSNDLIVTIAEKVIEARNNRLANDSVLNILNKEKENIERKLKNIMSAIDNGIITPSTKIHLEEVEKEKEEVEGKILIEKTRVQLQITKEDVIEYLKTALKKQPKQMIDMLVKEIKLYNDKLEIYFKYNKTKNSNENNEALSIYTDTKSILRNTETVDIKIDGLI